jgi:signal peptidase I
MAVEGDSMRGFLNQGDLVLIQKLKSSDFSFSRGEIVVFKSPIMKNKHLIKRIIGLPNEKIQINDSGQIFINNQPLNEIYLLKSVKEPSSQTWILKEDEYFLLGDNRENSFDSRRFGPLSKSVLIGRYRKRLWPFFKRK